MPPADADAAAFIAAAAAAIYAFIFDFAAFSPFSRLSIFTSIFFA